MVVNIVGSGTLKTDLNGELLAISNSYTMKATPGKGSGFQFWSLATGTTTNMVNTPSLTFTMVSNLVITATFVDDEAPVLKIVSPKANAKETNGTVTVSGTATDNVGVTAVGVQINSNGWVLADGSNNWSATLSISSGANTVEAYAMDAAGNISKTNSVKFTGDLPPDWAPDSLAGSTIVVTPDNGSPVSASFEATTFSQTDTTTTNDSGTGTYAYTTTDTNAANLSLTFTAPLIQSNNTPQNITLAFTNFNLGVFTNGEDTGSFAIVPAATLLPSSFSGHTITAVDASGQSTNTVKFTSKTELTVTQTGGSSSTDGYVATAASPLSAIFLITTTTGDFKYLQVTFTSKTGGNFEIDNYDNTAIFTDADFGTFTYK